MNASVDSRDEIELPRTPLELPDAECRERHGQQGTGEWKCDPGQGAVGMAEGVIGIMLLFR